MDDRGWSLLLYYFGYVKKGSTTTRAGHDQRHESNIEERRKGKEDLCACVKSILSVRGEKIIKVACIHTADVIWIS